MTISGLPGTGSVYVVLVAPITFPFVFKCMPVWTINDVLALPKRNSSLSFSNLLPCLQLFMPLMSLSQVLVLSSFLWLKAERRMTLSHRDLWIPLLKSLFNQALQSACLCFCTHHHLLPGLLYVVSSLVSLSPGLLLCNLISTL